MLKYPFAHINNHPKKASLNIRFYIPLTKNNTTKINNLHRYCESRIF